MTDEMIARLERLSRRTAAVTDLVATMRSHAPRNTDGWDSTGTVRVALGADGLPTAVRIEHNWRQSISPESLGKAVMEASTAAVTESMDSWSQTLDQLSWQERIAALRTDANQRADLAPSPDPLRPAREFTELTEDVLRSLTEVRRQVSAPPSVIVSRDSSQHITIALSSTSLASCSVEPAWAARQSGYSLTTAFTQALAAARAELDKQKQQFGPGSADDLVSDALNALSRLRAEAEESARRSL